MHARLIAVGERAPAWVAQGFAEYQKRLTHWLPLALVEVEPGVRGKGRDAARATHDEGTRVIAALPKHAHVVALDGRGRAHNSEALAQRLEHWRGQGRDLALLIGGPEGHATDVLARADEQWSLGPLTLPHMLVRLLVAEQLYRAAALLANHPTTAREARWICLHKKRRQMHGFCFTRIGQVVSGCFDAKVADTHPHLALPLKGRAIRRFARSLTRDPG